MVKEEFKIVTTKEDWALNAHGNNTFFLLLEDNRKIGSRAFATPNYIIGHYRNIKTLFGVKVIGIEI